MKLLSAAVLAALLVSTTPMPALADFSLSVNIAPPELPIYVQPMMPSDGYHWIPGYWAYDQGDYYWVPGTWVRPPRVGLLWTPGYWAWNVNVFSFHSGYWGSQVGYYGGVNYGYGYGGRGYEGGRWDGGRFMYNRAVNNINTRNVNVNNVYNRTVINNTTINRVSYNGGNGGIDARPNEQERVAERGKQEVATSEQTKHERTARSKPELRRAANKGRPPIAATARPADFDAKGVVPAKDLAEKPASDKRAERKSQANATPSGAPAAPASESRPGKNAHGNEPAAKASASTNAKRGKQKQESAAVPVQAKQPAQEKADRSAQQEAAQRPPQQAARAEPRSQEEESQPKAGKKDRKQPREKPAADAPATLN